MIPEVAIILPSLNRAGKLVRAIDNILSTSKGVNLELIIVLDEDDLTSQGEMNKLGYPTIISPPRSTPIFKWNLGAKNSTANWLYECSDDTKHPDRWLYKALSTPNFGFMALSDGQVKPWSPFYMATRDWLKSYHGGVLAVPHYHHWGNDLEACTRATNLGHYVLAHGVVVDHLHFIFNKAKKDSTYRVAEPHYQADIDMFNTRKALGFPDDFEPVL